MSALSEDLSPSIAFKDHERAIEGITNMYRLELGKAKMQVLLYREALEDAGIEPPDREDEELVQLWRDAQAVISSATEFVHHLGSGREMLDHSWRLHGHDPWTEHYATRWKR